MKSLFLKIKKRLIEVHQKYGWKAVAGIVAYYLIRDITLYIIIPMWAFSELK